MNLVKHTQILRSAVILYFTLVFSAQLAAYEQPNQTESIATTPVCDANDPSYKKVGGRNICKRECRVGEIGQNGKACTTREDTGTEEKLCDCGV